MLTSSAFWPALSIVGAYSEPEFGLADQSLAISAVSYQEATLLGLGRGMGETVRIVKCDGKALLAYSGYVLQTR